MMTASPLLLLLLHASPAAAMQLGNTFSRRSIVSVASAAAFQGSSTLPAVASVVEEVKALGNGQCTAGQSAAPTISARSKSINLVAKVTVTAPPGEVDFTYLKDADSGGVLAASKTSTLVTSIDKGKTVKPVVRFKDGGCVEGAAVALSPGFSDVQ